MADPAAIPATTPNTTPASTARARDLARLLLLGGPLVVAAFVAKLHKNAVLGGSPLDGARALGGDLLLLGALGLLGAALGGVIWPVQDGAPGRTLPRTLGRLALHVVFPFLASFLVAEHGFFVITGAVGDAYVLVEAARRWGEVQKIVLSEVTPARAALLSLPVLWSIVVLGLLTPLARSVLSRLPWRGRAETLGTCVAFLGLGAVLVQLPLAEDLRALGRAPLWATAEDLLRIAFESEGLALAGSSEEFEPVELRRRPGTPRARNVVFVVLESTSAKATDLYGPHRYSTKGSPAPFLRTLRAEGALAEAAYSVVPHTSKALVGIHCGIYPKFDIRIDEAREGGIPAECLPRLLREEGFRTAFFQSAEESYENRSELVREMGFEHFVGKESIDGRGFDEASYFGYEDDALLAPALAWMREQKEPFFASLLTVSSHHPYAVPKGFAVQRFTADARLNDYLNTVAYADRFVGKLWRGLEEAGLTKDTLVVITGDHGEAFGEHGRFQHDSAVYDETLRVPLLLAGAGVTPGSLIRGLRQHIDLAPTALDAVGFDAVTEGGGAPFLGRSLFEPEGHERLFMHCHYQRYCRGIRDGSLKFIDNYRRRGPEAYDLSKDALEQKNLLKDTRLDPKLKARAGWMRSEMERITRANLARYNSYARSKRANYVSKAPPSPRHALDADFGPVTLVGYDLEPTTIEAGDTAFLTLYYRVDEAPPKGFVPFFHAHGHKKIDYDHSPVAGSYPVKDWEPGEYVRDRFPLRTRPRYPARDYELVTGFSQSGKRVTPKVSAAAARSGTRVHLGGVAVGTLTLTHPKVDTAALISETPPSDAGMPPNALARPVRFGDALELTYAALDRHEIKAGIKVHALLVWRVLATPREGTRFRLRVDGPDPATVTHVPLGGALPWSAWRPGTYVRDDAELLLSERQKGGSYTVRLTEEGSDAPAAALGALRITRM